MEIIGNAKMWDRRARCVATTRWLSTLERVVE
jgi:hypothetical protein